MARFVIEGSDTKETITTLRLQMVGDEVTLVANNGAWHVLSITPEGKLRRHKYLGVSSGFCINGDGQIKEL